MVRNYYSLLFLSFFSLTLIAGNDPIVDSTVTTSSSASSTGAVDIAKPDFVKKSVRFHGSIGINGNYYTATNIDARRPANVGRFSFNSSFEVGRYFKMPLSINMSSLPVHYGSFEDHQGTGNTTVLEFLQNPVNTVGLGLHYKTFKLDFGTSNSVQYSDLTMGGLPMFGAGLSWNLGKAIVLQVNHGVAAQAIDQDTSNFVQGQYRRDITAVKFGFGNIQKSYMALNVVYGADQVGSVNSIDSSVYAESGIVASVDFNFKIGRAANWKGEIAGSIFTGDHSADEIDLSSLGIAQLDQITGYFPFKTSTFADFAAKSSISQSYKYWSLALNGEYIGAGFRTMGQPFLQADRIDLTVNPSMKLFKNKVNFSINGGYRINNLSGTKSATMNQILASSNLSITAAKGFTLNFNYSNFGVNNNAIGDTLRVRNTSQAFGFSPSYTHEGKHGSNVYSASATYNDFQDFNIVSGALNSNASMVYSASYNRTFKNNPLTIGFSGSQFDMSSTLFEVHTTNLSLPIGYSFFKKTLTTNLTSTYSINRAGGPDSDNQLSFRLTVGYNAPFGLQLNLSASNNQYNYAATSGLDFYAENLIQLGLRQKF